MEIIKGYCCHSKEVCSWPSFLSLLSKVNRLKRTARITKRSSFLTWIPPPPNSCAPSYTPKCLEFSGLVSWKSFTTQNSSSSTLPVPSLFQLVTEDETSNVNSPALTTRCWQFETAIVGLTGVPFGRQAPAGQPPLQQSPALHCEH